jgi:hypothetical protein
LRTKYSEESSKAELKLLTQMNEQAIVELKKEREIRDNDRKEFHQVTTTLYDRLIDVHENKYQDNRADTRMYFDKILDLTNNIVNKIHKDV